MRLRTYESFGLLNNGIINSYPSLHDKDEKCELVVVGGGITGALVSHALIEKGYRVVLLDKRDIGAGSTAATTSLLQYEVDVPLFRLAQMIGEEEAVNCYKAGLTAIHQLRELVQKFQFQCGFENKESLYIVREQKDLACLKQEFQFRDKYQLGVRWLEEAEIKHKYGIRSKGAICSDTAASMDAYRLTHQLMAYNISRGLKVYDQTTIHELHSNEASPYLITSNNRKVHYQKIIFCTGYEAVQMIKEKIAKLFYTYACVSEQGIELPQTLKETLIWDTGAPYFYMRYTNDKRLIIGGEDSEFDFPLFQQKIKERKAMKLQSWLRHLTEQVSFIEDFSWAGKFGSTKDGLPYIGQSPEHKNTLFVLGFGGNGITFSVQAMRIIPDLLEGKRNELIHPYRFGR